MEMKTGKMNAHGALPCVSVESFEVQIFWWFFVNVLTAVLQRAGQGKGNVSVALRVQG
jgi:hypothetical protein